MGDAREGSVVNGKAYRDKCYSGSPSVHQITLGGGGRLQAAVRKLFVRLRSGVRGPPYNYPCKSAVAPLPVPSSLTEVTQTKLLASVVTGPRTWCAMPHFHDPAPKTESTPKEHRRMGVVSLASRKTTQKEVDWDTEPHTTSERLGV